MIDDLQHVEQLALVLMQPLYLDVEQGLGVHLDPGGREDDGGELPLVGLFDRMKLLLKRGVPGVGFEIPNMRKIADPPVADRARDERGQAGIRVGQPAAVRHAVGLVLELLRPQFVEIRYELLFHQLGMQLRHPVDRVTAGYRQIGHAHLALRALLDQRHVAQPALVARPSGGHGIEEAVVDLVDDFEVPRQYVRQQIHRPSLQSLAHQGVIGVGAGRAGDLPGLVPRQVLFVHQRAHQFDDRECGVRIVHLHRNLIGEIGDIRVLFQVPAEHVANRAGHQKILLHQAQFPAGRAGVRRVQDLGDFFRFDLVFERAQVIALVENPDIEALRGACGKEPQDVDRAAAASHDGDIVRNADELFPTQPHGIVIAVAVLAVLHVAVNGNDRGLVGTMHHPG